MTIEGFSGLNLVDDPLEVGARGSIDMLDADLDTRGRVRCRDGWTKFTSSAVGGDVLSIMGGAPLSGGKMFAWATTTGTYYALDSAGVVISSNTPTSGLIAPMFCPGYPSIVATVAHDGHLMAYNTVSDAWSDVDFSASVAVADSWTVILRTPLSSRLVLSGGVTDRDRVTFSNVDGTFTAANWVQVGYLDGESTVGGATYRDLTIIFKQTKFFVFTGESIDSDGNPIFNYRTVNSGVGLAARFATAVAPEGVYFLDKNGVFLTSGDAPTKVSGAIDPLFRGNVNSDTYSGSAVNQASISTACMTYYRERLYVAVPTGSATVNDRLLVFDPKTGDWLVWSIGAGCLTVHRRYVTSVFQEEELFFGYATGTNDIGRYSRAFTTDNGSAIAWNRKSGRYPLVDAGHVAVTQESALVGSGTVTLRLDSDLYSNQSASATLGTAPAIAEGWPSPVDQEGTWLQHKLSGSGPGSVSRLTHLISSAKPAGVR